jgi:diguanylate cyclase (GGDEF)-like protein/PAS domain S-box-containing protein
MFFLGQQSLDHLRPRECLPQAIAEQLERYCAVCLSQRQAVQYETTLLADEKIRTIVINLYPVQESNHRISEIVGACQDITERKQTEEMLRQAEDRYRSFFENAVEGIFITTVEGHYLSANPMLARIYGYDSPEALITSVQDIQNQLYVNPSRRQEFIQLIQEHKAIWEFESQIYRQDGSIIWISENARAVLDAQGHLIGFEGTVEDITARKQDQATIEFMAYYDMLTELPNRELFNNRLTHAIAHAQRCHELLAVLFLDLDRFKTINDTLGHSVGDRLLQGVAERLKACVRCDDTIARWGGDEFTLLLTQIGTAEQAAKLAQRILDVFHAPIEFDGRSLHVTCSLGIALYPHDGADAHTLLKNADTALYRVKEQGRNNYQLYTPAMNAEAVERLVLENRLRYALESGEFVLYYQPQIQVSTGRIRAMEALLRWNHPDWGLVPPASFIPIAEESGLITAIGEWALHAACAQNKAWQEAGLPAVRVAVNLSARQFQQANLVDRIAQILEETGLDPCFLELEITEGVVMSNVDQAITVLHQLRAMGIQLSMDDFGIGYSSMNYLRKFPLHALKIDRSFVLELTTNRNDAAIVKAMLALGHSLNLRVIAEGVETVAHQHLLQSMGCDEMQGYCFARPVPPDHASQRLRDQSQSY